MKLEISDNIFEASWLSVGKTKEPPFFHSGHCARRQDALSGHGDGEKPGACGLGEAEKQPCPERGPRNGSERHY